tara:strand:- start:1775 stop:1966 length:192 start_codon:yes stop_codon:yes gene_type:complete
MSKKSPEKNNSKVIPPPPSFVKLAMRNMVRKGGQSLIHLSFTAFGFLTFIVLIAWLGRPNLPN